MYSNGLQLGLDDGADDYYKAKMLKAKAKAKTKTTVQKKVKAVASASSEVPRPTAATNDKPQQQNSVEPPTAAETCSSTSWPHEPREPERSTPVAAPATASAAAAEAAVLQPPSTEQALPQPQQITAGSSASSARRDSNIIAEAQSECKQPASSSSSVCKVHLSQAEDDSGLTTPAVPPVCPRNGCPMSWTRDAGYLDYCCGKCRQRLRGTRWHCKIHEEDYCGKCHPAPEDSAGKCDVIDSSWKSGTSTSQKHSRDALGDLLAAQERMLQCRRLEAREALEAKEAWRTSSSPSRSCGSTAGCGKQTATTEPMSSEISQPSVNLMDENAACQRPLRSDTESKPSTSSMPLERACDLTLVLAGDLLDELARGYSQDWFQKLVRDCAKECAGHEDLFVAKLHDIAFEVQRPILENWGFDGDIQGVYDMTSIIREHTAAIDAPAWFQERRDACLSLLYGTHIF